MNRLEQTILKNLIYNDSYTRKVLPFIKSEYFSDFIERFIFSEIFDFVNEYKNLPTYESLVINFSNKRNISGDQLNDIVNLLNEIRQDKDADVKEAWLIDNTEKFCQDRAIHNAIMESVNILDKDKQGRGEIPNLLSKALSVSFNTNIGHDYMNDSEKRYDSYHRVESRIPFDLDMFNRITKGGFSLKTLNVFLAGPKVGKSLVMCHLASAYLYQGFNVLYITMEMAEEKISERIDANLLNISIDNLNKLSKEEYQRKFGKLKSKTQGSLIVKEYPTASASVLHFRALLNDLLLKKGFVPQVIIIDYLNICCSSRIKMGATGGSYFYIKSIAEELRGLAVEYNVPVISATQTTRVGFKSSDPGMEDTSESFGLPATVDFMCAIVTNDELAALNQFLFVQLASRYSDINYYKRFIVGVDKSKMKLYNAEESSQSNLSADSGQDKTFNIYSDRTTNFNDLKV
jgi:replicative DNA helicase